MIAKKMITRVSFTIFLLFSITHFGYGRFIREDTGLVSDGLDPKIQVFTTALTTTVTCEPIYGFLPCTTKLWGQLFLIVVYEFLLSLGEKYISDGSDLFFKLTGPGYFGASLFHLLPTIPQISLVLVSGLSGSTTTARQQAAMGMNLLAGSAVMLLTLVWASCVAFGSYDLSTGEHKKQSSLTGFGVRTDPQTSDTAKIMMLSMVPLLILQLAKIINSSTGTRVVVLVSLVVTLAFLLAYSSYQVFRPWIQDRKFEYLTQKFVKNKLLKLLSHNGKPNIALIKEIFHEIDKNNDGVITTTELRLLVLGIQLEGGGDIKDDYVKRVMEKMDISGDARIDETEFVRVLSKWLTEARQSITKADQTTPNFFSRIKGTQEEQQSLVPHKKKNSGVDRSWWNYAKAAFQLLVGTALLAVLAQPLIKTVGNFSTAANIPSFLVPYVVIPFAMNYRRARSAISSARKKTENSLSLTLSEIYGSVFMSNMVGLTVFLLLVYIRDLSWDVSAEVLVVLIICTVMGLFTSFRREFPLWTSYFAYLLYPISLVLLYVLTTVLGWS